MITCCSLNKLSSIAKPGDVNLFIVRNQKAPVNGLTHFPQLAPSKALYSFAMQNKETDGWWDVYKSSFEQELETMEKKVAMEVVESFVAEGLRVNLVCYCGEPDHCHRSLVAKALIDRGNQVKVL